MKHQKGVTMIDLVITVAILGVITAIAYPSYQAHTFKGHRSQVMADLMKIQLTLEDNYTQSGAYDYSIISGNTCAFCEIDTTRYHISVDASGTGMDNYKLVATPQSRTNQTDDECGTLYLNAAGVGTAKKGNTMIDGCW
ncbi:type IV pilin protein [Photobacterium japonica]|uniref:type IV pilin protein n=1 Tax=Photobacterium japonica TaxID=2910235 RepID=UPI003D0A451F